MILWKNGKGPVGTIRRIKVGKKQFLYAEAADNSESRKKTRTKFEARFPSLTDRKMYGLDYELMRFAMNRWLRFQLIH